MWNERERSVYIALSSMGTGTPISLRAWLLEALTPFRPDPLLADDLASIEERPDDATNYPTQATATVPSSWLDQRVAATAVLDGACCTVTDEESLLTLRWPEGSQGQRRGVEATAGEQRLPSQHRRAHPLGGERNWGRCPQGSGSAVAPAPEAPPRLLSTCQDGGRSGSAGYQSCPTRLPEGRSGQIPHICEALGVDSLPWE